jgi:hypothetical protein
MMKLSCDAHRAKLPCKRGGLFLLVEVQRMPFPAEKWSLFCTETGRVVATYFPGSRSLLLMPENNAHRCKDWPEAIARAAARRVTTAARLAAQTEGALP